MSGWIKIVIIKGALKQNVKEKKKMENQGKIIITDLTFIE